MDGGAWAAHLDGCQRRLLPSDCLQKVVLPMHKHNAASAEQERTQPRDTGSPRGPQRQWEAAPHRCPAGNPPRAVCGGRLAHKPSGLKRKRKKTKLTELYLGLFVVFFSCCRDYSKNHAHPCFRAGSRARRCGHSRRCSSCHPWETLFFLLPPPC